MRVVQILDARDSQQRDIIRAMRTRRTFLKSAPVLAGTACTLPAALLSEPASPVDSEPARPQVSSAAATASALSSSFDPWVEVHPANLRHNAAEIERRVGGRPILAVIKNNGYGLGVVNAARHLEPIPAIAGFAVVKLQEAVTLRAAGVRKPILLMGPFTDAELDEVVARRITPMVYTPIAAALERAARKRQRRIPVHVCVDTGIGRVGVPHARAAALVRELAAAKSVRIDGTMTTFTEDAEFDKEQLSRFQSLCRLLRNEGSDLGRLHAASSYGLFQRPDAFLDMVRPGMALFGVYSEADFRKAGVLDLRPAVSLRARVIYVKQLAKGESAGYNRAYVAKSDVWVATLPVGHADGWPREAAKGVRVRIGGRLCPVIASVSASHTIVELGSEPTAQIGDVATLFDWQEGSRPEDVGAACGASVYDLTMHLNPLLQRRVVETPVMGREDEGRVAAGKRR
jgi:alanine racemase